MLWVRDSDWAQWGCSTSASHGVVWGRSTGRCDMASCSCLGHWCWLVMGVPPLSSKCPSLPLWSLTIQESHLLWDSWLSKGNGNPPMPRSHTVSHLPHPVDRSFHILAKLSFNSIIWVSAFKYLKCYLIQAPHGWIINSDTSAHLHLNLFECESFIEHLWNY